MIGKIAEAERQATGPDMVNTMQWTRILTLARGEPGRRQQYDAPGPIIDPACAAPLPVRAGEQPRVTGKRDDHHDAAIALAVTVHANTARACRIPLDGEVIQDDAGCQWRFRQAGAGDIKACLKKKHKNKQQRKQKAEL